jgi:hypothetical protein
VGDQRGSSDQFCCRPNSSTMEGDSLFLNFYDSVQLLTKRGISDSALKLSRNFGLCT